MKKRNMKKGFTLVELVIVIAVIAILAGVLIPTFGGIIDKAQKSAAEQAAMNEWKEFYALDLSDGVLDGKDAAEADKEIKLTNPKGKYTVEEGTVSYFYSNGKYDVKWDSADKKWTTVAHTSHVYPADAQTGTPCIYCDATKPA